MITASALTTTLAGHAYAVGGLDLAPVAPFLWGMLLLLSVPIGARRSFVPRGLLQTAALLVAVQAVLHLSLMVAPWAFGVAAHHHEMPLIDFRSATIHLLVGLVFALLLRGADRALAVAVAIVRRLRRTERWGALPRRWERVLDLSIGAPTQDHHRPRSSRGPPVPHALLSQPMVAL